MCATVLFVSIGIRMFFFLITLSVCGAGSRGEAIFKGRIRIPAQAQGADADQLCRSIMLGRRARLQAMPTLEISADKVACSHGASVADLDENSLFYIAARGISRQVPAPVLCMLLCCIGDLHVADNYCVLCVRWPGSCCCKGSCWTRWATLSW